MDLRDHWMWTEIIHLKSESHVLSHTNMIMNGQGISYQLSKCKLLNNDSVPWSQLVDLYRNYWDEAGGCANYGTKKIM